MKIELRELSVQDNEEIFEMIQEIGPGENGFVNSLYDNSFNHFQIKLRKNDEMSKGSTWNLIWCRKPFIGFI
jgi:hypothetical protein